MEDQDGIKLAKRIERWGKRLAALGVAHWEIEAVHIVERTPGGPGARATVQCSTDYDVCEFWFRESFLDEASKDDLDLTIIHEWLHVAMRDFDHAVEATEKWMPEATYESFEAALDHEREGLVDRLARALFTLHTGRKPRFSP